MASVEPKLTEENIAELAEFFDLLAKHDYEDHKGSAQQNGAASDDPI